MMYKIIDVSIYQGKPDWKMVKASGVDGAILRILDRKGTKEEPLFCATLHSDISF